MHRPRPSVHPRKLPACSSCSTHKRKRPSEWGHAVGFPLWTVLGVLGRCKPPLWPVLDLSDGACWGLWWSSLGCHGHLQTLPGTFTVWIYLWNTFGSLASFDVCLYFWALPQELGKLAEAGSQQALPVGTSFGWNLPSGIDSWGFRLEAKLLDAVSFLFSKIWAFWVILMRSKNPEHKCSRWRTKTPLV